MFASGDNHSPVLGFLLLCELFVWVAVGPHSTSFASTFFPHLNHLTLTAIMIRGFCSMKHIQIQFRLLPLVRTIAHLSIACTFQAPCFIRSSTLDSPPSCVVSLPPRNLSSLPSSSSLIRNSILAGKSSLGLRVEQPTIPHSLARMCASPSWQAELRQRAATSWRLRRERFNYDSIPQRHTSNAAKQGQDQDSLSHLARWKCQN